MDQDINEHQEQRKGILPPELQTKLEVYLETYERVIERVGNVDAACVMVQEIATDLRELIGGPRELAPSYQMPAVGSSATEKQIKYLQRLGYTAAAGLSRSEASAIIDRVLAGEARSGAPPGREVAAHLPRDAPIVLPRRVP